MDPLMLLIIVNLWINSLLYKEIEYNGETLPNLSNIIWDINDRIRWSVGRYVGISIGIRFVIDVGGEVESCDDEEVGS